MNAAISNALSAIKRAGGYQIPDYYEVEKAQSGKKWFGEKKDGSHWMLIKHGQDSYNVSC